MSKSHSVRGVYSVENGVGQFLATHIFCLLDRGNDKYCLHSAKSFCRDNFQTQNKSRPCQNIYGELEEKF